jgi:hypothetical protein
MEVAGAKLAAPIGPLPTQAEGTQQGGHEEVGGGAVTHLGRSERFWGGQNHGKYREFCWILKDLNCFFSRINQMFPLLNPKTGVFTRRND